ncbi:MAG TPA: hypothetical protein VI365_26250 [Trebonia sp.]
MHLALAMLGVEAVLHPPLEAVHVAGRLVHLEEINTSFNWLSFRGDSDRTYRMEEGTLVAIPGRVDKEYAHYRALIEQQAR